MDLKPLNHNIRSKILEIIESNMILVTFNISISSLIFITFDQYRKNYLLVNFSQYFITNNKDGISIYIREKLLPEKDTKFDDVPHSISQNILGEIMKSSGDNICLIILRIYYVSSQTFSKNKKNFNFFLNQILRDTDLYKKFLIICKQLSDVGIYANIDIKPFKEIETRL